MTLGALDLEWISHGSLALIGALLIAEGFGLPLSEDVLLLTAGVIAHRSGISLPVVIAGCGVCVLLGDAVLVSLARRLGPRVQGLLDRVSPKRRDALKRWIELRGGWTILVARHVPWLRSVVFILAGLQGMSLRRFLAWDALGVCITAPAMVGLGYGGSHHLDQIQAGVHRLHGYLIVIAGALVIVGTVVYGLTRRRRPTPKASPSPSSC